MIEISMKEVARGLTMTVRIRGVKEWRMRLWIAVRLIKLAARVAWFTVKIEDKTKRHATSRVTA